MESRYSIKDLEQLAGIKAHTLRAWESRYSLITPYRTDTNIRYYSDDHLKKILNISILVKSGMKIGNVARMSYEEINTAVSTLGKQQKPFEGQVSKLKLAMLDYDEAAFESILNSCFIKYGVDETLDNVVGVFIKEVGILWQTNKVSVAQEHFVTNLIKMKLFSLIDNLNPSYTSTTKNVLLFLPSEELHELSLLYLYYFLKSSGFRVLYLGQSTPLEYVKEVTEHWKADFLITVCTTQPHFEGVSFYFERIEELFPGSEYQFFLTGFKCEQMRGDSKPSNIEVVPSVTELKERFKQMA